MSIVESALGKLRADPAASARLEASVPRRPPPGHAPPARPAPFTTSKSFVLDLERLRNHGVLAPEDSARRTLDEFRRIKWPLLAAANPADAAVARGNLIMVASSVPGEGKTFTAVNLALSFAQERDTRLLVVDADVVKPRLTQLFGLEKERGLTDLLADPNLDLSDAVLASSVPNLFVLPAGTPSQNTPELLASRRMEQLTERLVDSDGKLIVLFDSSPLLLTNESHVLSKLVGQVLMVVRAGETTQPVVVEALTHIDPGAKVSCVLNQLGHGFGTDYYYYNTSEYAPQPEHPRT